MLIPPSIRPRVRRSGELLRTVDHGSAPARLTLRAIDFVRHLPKLTQEEKLDIERLIPRGPEEWREIQEEERFLRGEVDGGVPESGGGGHSYGSADGTTRHIEEALPVKLRAGNLFVAKLGERSVFEGEKGAPVVAVRKEQDAWVAALWTQGDEWQDLDGKWPTREEAQRALLEHCASVLPARWWPLLLDLWP